MQATNVRTNLVTNPSLEVDLTGYTAYKSEAGDTLPALTRDTDESSHGDASAKVEIATNTGQQGLELTVSGLTVGVQYAFSAHLKLSETGAARLALSGGATSDVTASKDSFQQFALVFTATATSHTLRATTSLSDVSLWVDALMLEETGTQGGYVDGSLGGGYGWAGTAHASISTYTPFDAAADRAFRRVRFGFLASFLKNIDDTTDLFTIGDSDIEGPDFIPSAGGVATMFDYYDYDDFSQYLTTADIAMRLGDKPYGMIMSQLDVELNNTSKLFLPGFDPDIGDYVTKPGRPVKASVSFDGESIPQFVGYSDIPEHSKITRKTKLHAYDALEYLNGYEVQATTFVDQTLDEVIEAVLIEAGFSADQYDLEPSVQDPIGFVSARDLKAGALFKDLCESEQYTLWVDEEGVIRGWNRQHLVANNDPVWALDFDEIEDLQYVATPIINDVIVRALPRAVQPTQKVWELDSPLEIPAGETKEIFAEFKDDYGEMPVTTVDEPVYVTLATSPQESSYSTNANQDGTGATLDSFITLDSVSLLGKAYKMVFSNTYTSTVYIRTIELYGTPAKVTAVIEERRRDETSVAEYGVNPQENGEPIEIENDYIQTRDNALALAFALVEGYKNPLIRFRGKLARAVPHLQFGDVVTVNDEDAVQVRDMFIVGQQKTFGLRSELTQELELELRADVQYFTVGGAEASSIGGTDALAP